MRIGVVKVSSELLVQALHFPPGTVIFSCQDAGSQGGVPGDVWLTVSHPDLAPVKPGQVTPTLCPQYRGQEPVVFERWGQPDEGDE